MADAIELFLDVSTPQGAAVKSLSDKNAFTLGPFYQGSLLQLRITPVVPTGSTVTAPYYAKVPITNLDLQAYIGPAAGNESILASQPTWTKQLTADTEGKSGYFYASLNLNTTELNTAIATSAFYDTYFEVLLSRSGAAFSPVFQSLIRVMAVVKGPAGAASTPTPTVDYLTRDQAMNLFVLWRNDLVAANAGRNIVLLSPDGAHTRELGVGNSAEPIDNPS